MCVCRVCFGQLKPNRQIFDQNSLDKILHTVVLLNLMCVWLPCVCFCASYIKGVTVKGINRLWELLKHAYKQSLSLDCVGDHVTLIMFGLLGGSPDQAEK